MTKTIPPEIGCYSSHIVFVDESGDHSLVKIDKDFPVFVLAFCVFDVRSYTHDSVPALQNFKFDYFGHDQVVLHEREIRKCIGDFRPLIDRTIRHEFMTHLSQVIEESEFTIVSVLIDKLEYLKQHPDSDNCYEIALRAALPFVYSLLKSSNDVDCHTHVVFESRGAVEDNQLELDFLRICSGENPDRIHYPLRFKNSSKKCNSSGLQLADLVARPIARKFLRPEQNNRAFDILAEKFASEGLDGVMGNIVLPIKQKAPKNRG